MNEGVVHHQAGRYHEAELIYRAILNEIPQHYPARFYLGTCLLQQDEKKDEGAIILEPFLALTPPPNAVLINLGLYHFVAKKYDKAEDLFRKAVAVEPNSADIHNKLACTCFALKREPEAIYHFQQALIRNPALLTAYPPLVGSLRDRGRFIEAYIWADRWLWAEPDVLLAKAEQGMSLAKARFYDAAWALISQLPEDKPELLFFRAYLRQYLHDFSSASADYRKVMELAPEVANSHFNLSLMLLASGEFEEGWREFDHRFDENAPIGPHGHQEQEWDGCDLGGAGILVHSEQGIGDVIQFMRFFPQVQARGGKVVFSSYTDILTLLKGHEEAEVIQEIEKVDLSYTWQIPLLTLGKIFVKRSEDIPATVPYLTAPKEKVKHWEKRLANDKSFKVGLAWAGNPDHVNDHNRSTSLADFMPLSDVAGVTYYALQKGPTASQANCPPRDMWLVSLEKDIADFTDTAAIVDNLDLVICIDTSVAHLAGALGKSVWMVLPDIRDWRWIEGRDSSPWYPSMRLFRRQQEEEWSKVFERVAKALSNLLLENPPLDQAVQHEISASRLAEKGDLLSSAHAYQAAIAAGGETGRILRHAAYSLHGLVADMPAWMDRGEMSSTLRLLFAQQENADTAIADLSVLQQSHPEDAGYALALARKLREAGRIGEAGQVAESALEKHPERWDIRYELAQCQKLTERLVDAEANYQAILKISPRYAEAGINRAMMLDRLGKPTDAIQQMQLTALCHPYHPLVRRFLGILLMQQRQYDLALLVIVEHRKRYRSDAAAQFYHAAILRQLGRHSEALELLESMPPGHDDPYETAQEATFCRMVLRPETAVSEIQKLIANAPPGRHAQLEYSLGLQLLTNGNMVAGWAHCESRRRVVGSDTFEQQFRTTLPAWQGEPLSGRRLLIFCEQGFGDTIQFLRYLHSISGTCILIYQDGLDELLSAGLCRPDTLLVSRDSYRAAPVAADCYANLLSLPHLLRQGEAVMSPYLHLPSDENAMAKHFANEPRRKIGIVWAGNPKHLADRWRSISLRKLLPPLLEIPGIAWYSLQKDIASNEALLLPEGTPWLNAAANTNTFFDTAQVLQQLDLIISVDTAIAHLAGAMDKPVWLLLPAQCDWRWGMDGEKTAWYPSMRIFRQTDLGDWTPVIEALQLALREHQDAA